MNGTLSELAAQAPRRPRLGCLAAIFAALTVVGLLVSAGGIPSGGGRWTITSHTSQRGGIVFWFGDGPWSEAGATVAFEVEGSISKPVLVCQYPDGAHACTYTRRS
jgi:hypothetical protein